MGTRDRLARIALSSQGGPQSTPPPSEAPTALEYPSELHRRLAEMFDGLRHGTDPNALGPLGAVIPQLMPMLLRKFNEVPEQKLRFTIATLCGKLAEVIEADDPADVIEPFQPLPPDVSRETSATLVPPPYARANAEHAEALGLQLVDESAAAPPDAHA